MSDNLRCHFKEFTRIKREQGLAKAINYDFGESLDDLGNVAEGAISSLFMGAAMGALWITSPVILGYPFFVRELKEHGDFREKQAKKLSFKENLNLRQRFNESVRNLGNRVSSGMKNRFNYGLGDLVTEDVNFRKAGAVVGTLTPLALVYAANTMEHSPSEAVIWTGAMAIAGGPISYIASIIGGGLGYLTGDKIDSLLGDKSRENYRGNDNKKFENNTSLEKSVSA